MLKFKFSFSKVWRFVSCQIVKIHGSWLNKQLKISLIFISVFTRLSMTLYIYPVLWSKAVFIQPVVSHTAWPAHAVRANFVNLFLSNKCFLYNSPVSRASFRWSQSAISCVNRQWTVLKNCTVVHLHVWWCPWMISYPERQWVIIWITLLGQHFKDFIKPKVFLMGLDFVQTWKAFGTIRTTLKDIKVDRHKWTILVK